MSDMASKKRILITLGLITVLSGFNFAANANEQDLLLDLKSENKGNLVAVLATEAKPASKTKIAPAAKSQATVKINNAVSAKSTKVSYKIFTNKETNSDYAVVYINNAEVVKYNTEAGGFPAEARAKILVNRLQQFLAKNGNPKDILPGKENGVNVGRVGSLVLFTADHKNAKELGLSPAGLSIYWVNNIRKALGAPQVVRDNSHIASRGNVSAAFASKYLGLEQVGIASWYGGVFHGRRSADGSRFSKHEFTAAHKTLPFGTLVKVTNLNNNKSCIVKITDRGPFVPGRVIDLSKAAAKETGILSAGISKVRLEVIGKY